MSYCFWFCPLTLQRTFSYTNSDTDTGATSQRDSESFVFLDQISERMARVLQTHALQVSFKEIVDGFELDGKGE